MDGLLALVLLAIAIAALVSASRARQGVRLLEHLLEGQRSTIESLERAIDKLRTEVRSGAAPSPAKPAAPVTPPAVAAPLTVVTPTKTASLPEALPPPEQARTPPAVPPSAQPPDLPPEPVAPPRPPFDWESLIGVKMFAAVAGIAAFVAAVFFLNIAIQEGWLGPRIRVALGILVSVALLVFCERKAARVYRVTANALDGAAIAILFATFYAAHAYWSLIPGPATFLLLGLVTFVAVLLSIRRDSLFIAVLGLIGGFMTPALLSTGENRPIALFSYLLLLNVGLAWVAYRRRWPALTILSAALTALYQWGWVFKFLFLNQGQLPLAMGIFLIFPVAALAVLAIGSGRRAAPDGADAAFEQTGLFSAVMPLIFSLYLAAIPGYGARAGLLFGFLIIVDVGLLAVAVARREERLHLAAGAGTIAAVAIWLGLSYVPSAWTPALVALSVLAVVYLAGPAIARWAGRPFGAIGARATYTAPLLLAAFAFLARTPRAGESPAALFVVLFVLAGLMAWRAIASRQGGLYFVSSFFVLAALAAWSEQHLMTEALGTAVSLYAAFGVFALVVPVVARRWARPLEPAEGSGVVLLCGLPLLLFLAWSPVAPSAIWGLALLLAILNAAIFVESAFGRMPVVAIAGGAFSWIVLALWWSRAAAIVGIRESLLVVVLLALVMLAGHAWAHAHAARSASPETLTGKAGFLHGLFLGFVAHLFFAFVAANPAWSQPPEPLMGALAVVTLAMSVVALYTRVGELHLGSMTAASLVVLIWSATAASAPWPTVAIVAAGAVSAFALVWMLAFRRRAVSADAAGLAPYGYACAAAGAALFAAEATTIVATGQPGAPPIAGVITAHVVNVGIILTLAWRQRWPWVATLAVLPAAIALTAFADSHPEPDAWRALLALAVALYAVFVAYPFVLGRRIGANRDPHLAAVLASGVFLLAAREAFERGGLEHVIGAVPVVEGAILALLLRQLLRMETGAPRDASRVALVAGAALAFVTVAIPLQLDEQWITIGWALEGAALAWLCTRVPHVGLYYGAVGLLAVVFIRLALNPAVFYYEPRGDLRIFNWYLYTYAVSAAALIVAAVWLRRSAAVRESPPSSPGLLQAGGVILLFLVLNIEIADFYSTGPEITFQLGATLAQDLTYTIGWLTFGLVLLTAGIAGHVQPARIAALALIAITTFKGFLYDVRLLSGLHRVASFVGLAIALALVSIALQKYVLRPKPKADS